MQSGLISSLLPSQSVTFIHHVRPLTSLDYSRKACSEGVKETVESKEPVSFFPLFAHLKFNSTVLIFPDSGSCYTVPEGAQ